MLEQKLVVVQQRPQNVFQCRLKRLKQSSVDCVMILAESVGELAVAGWLIQLSP
jgi:hypothetical protein